MIFQYAYHIIVWDIYICYGRYFIMFILHYTKEVGFPTGASPSKGTQGETYVLAPPPIPAIQKLHPRLLAEEPEIKLPTSIGS